MSDQQLSPQSVLDQILNVGKEYLQKGQDLAEDKLNIPEQGEERELMLNGLKKGAIASAVLVGLIGTKGGRKLTGVALKLGSVAALGTVAYKGYQNWLEKRNTTGDTVKPVHDLDDNDAHQRSKLLITAMVAAANADGNIDDKEQQELKHQILKMHLPKSLAGELEAIIDSPADAQALAAQVTDFEAASEVYIASRLFIGKHSSLTERMYLEQLVAEMELDSELVESLEAQLA